ncbi:MAG: putative TrmH family tRNA/rRNA methyltransferase [candidate division BRC1 bacterium ADurb.BinA364]|nr:MAG: putative TrmH family tRNA/rRNA methyltransferase [candidate division BRC1 bacterium ADurb.BinA364]
MSKRGKSKPKPMENHQRAWVWGRRAVLEILRAGRWPMLELRLDERLPPEEIRIARQFARELSTPVRSEPAQRLFELCHARDHQGYLARMAQFEYETLDSLIARAARRARAAPLIAVLDSIQDPYNFGAILRSAEAFGVDGIVIGERGQADVNSLVARSSAGAVNHLPIARVDRLAAALERLKAEGYALIAASEKAEQACDRVDFRRPAALVLGNEGEGIAPGLLTLCGERARIPQSGTIGSLNVAAAAAVLFYEARRQRGATGSK